MSPWFDGSVTANGIRIHYTRTGAGSGKPPLVLVHGYSDNGLTWTRVAQAFESEWDVLMPDARGHGRSDAPADGYTLPVMGADLAAFCAALGLQRPVLVGHSMGGSIVGYVAAQEPDLARAAVLVDPAWTDHIDVEGLVATARARRLLSRQELADLVQSRHPNWTPEDRALWVESRLQLSDAGVEAGTQLAGQPAEAAGAGWRDVAARISCPALLLIAESGTAAPGSSNRPMDGIVTPAAAAEAQRLNAAGRIRVAHIAGAAHAIHYDRFEAFVAAVREFLAGV